MNKITGKTLIGLGFEPAPWFGWALKILNGLEGLSTQEIVYYCNQQVQENQRVELFEKPVHYLSFVKATSADEYNNVGAAIAAMNRIMRTPTIVAGALMPDVCPVGGDNIPVGGVAVTEGTIHPKMHSSDVCCSVATSELKFDANVSDILDVAAQVTHFGPGGRQTDVYQLEDDRLHERILGNYFTREYIHKATIHLGTQGDGNHFLFVGRSDETGKLHIVTHHGSRGFGAAVYKKALHEAEKYCKRRCPATTNPWLDYGTDLGKEYWEALQIVKSWTHLNHQIIHNRILNKIGIGRSDFYWNEHNFVFEDRGRFYHAKGSTPMSAKFNVGSGYSEKRLIPLNMAQPVLVVKENPNNTFGFAPHGAGRNLSRNEFNRRYKEADLQKEIEGLDIRFYSGKPDMTEFPSAYKNAESVVKQIEYFGLAKVVDRIQPLGCIMAGEQVKHWKKIK